jgi:hypothetical protein
MRVIKYVFNTCVFYVDFVRRRGWRRVYPMILPPRKASQKTRCVGHWTTRTNRRLGGLSTRGGFGRLSRTLLLFVGHVSRTGLAHKGDHLRAHLGIGPYMPGGWRKWRRCYELKERGMTPWSSANDNSRPSWPLWDHHMYVMVLISLHLQT